MPPPLEPEHLFSPQQPPSRRWVWGAGVLAAVSLVCVVLYIFVFSKPSKNSDYAYSAEAMQQQENAAALTPAPSEVKAPNALLSDTDETTALSLKALVASSPDEQTRYERHTSLLEAQRSLQQMLGKKYSGGEISPDAARVIQKAVKVAFDDLESGAVIAEEIKLQATYRLGVLKPKLSLPQTSQMITYLGQEAAGIIQLLKQDSDIYYGTKIDDIMKRSSLPLTGKLIAAYSFAEMNDPAITADLSEWLSAVIANDVANVVVTGDERQLAEQLLTQLKEV